MIKSENNLTEVLKLRVGQMHLTRSRFMNVLSQKLTGIVVNFKFAVSTPPNSKLEPVLILSLLCPLLIQFHAPHVF